MNTEAYTPFNIDTISKTVSLHKEKSVSSIIN